MDANFAIRAQVLCFLRDTLNEINFLAELKANLKDAPVQPSIRWAVNNCRQEHRIEMRVLALKDQASEANKLLESWIDN